MLRNSYYVPEEKQISLYLFSEAEDGLKSTSSNMLHHLASYPNQLSLPVIIR